MSYRRAWLLLEDLNRTLGQPVTTASVGGAGGGGARITPFGRHVVTAFREIELAAVTAAAPAAGLAAAIGRGRTRHAGGAATCRDARPRQIPRARACGRRQFRGGDGSGGGDAIAAEREPCQTVGGSLAPKKTWPRSETALTRIQTR